MDTASTTSKQCTDAHAAQFDDAMKLLGDFWNLRIIDAIGSGEFRFSELERAIGTCNPATLTNRLKKLEESGVIERKKETIDKQSVSYALTAKGHGAIEVLDAIKAFTDTYY